MVHATLKLGGCVVGPNQALCRLAQTPPSLNIVVGSKQALCGGGGCRALAGLVAIFRRRVKRGHVHGRLLAVIPGSGGFLPMPLSLAVIVL